MWLSGIFFRSISPIMLLIHRQLREGCTGICACTMNLCLYAQCPQCVKQKVRVHGSTAGRYSALQYYSMRGAIRKRVFTQFVFESLNLFLIQGSCSVKYCGLIGNGGKWLEDFGSIWNSHIWHLLEPQIFIFIVLNENGVTDLLLDSSL